jgi:hypothetical protein
MCVRDDVAQDSVDPRIEAGSLPLEPADAGDCACHGFCHRVAGELGAETARGVPQEAGMEPLVQRLPRVGFESADPFDVRGEQF